MQTLELQIPPPAVTLLMASAMWGVTWVAPSLEVPAFPRITVAVVIALVGFSFALAGIVSFRRAKTTVNPKKPSNATSLVNSGIYRVTRNPMYVGLLFVLVAWAVFLSCVWALLGPLAFVLYMSRFQISPEEKALATMFGSEYSRYKERVRRWL
jgi:protein-S-isoprenylcysteine O-methyltransferase Ste14